VLAHNLPTSSAPAYNVILIMWGVAAVRAMADDHADGKSLFGIAPLATIPLLVLAAQAETRWVAVQARHHPAWWNRALDPKRNPHVGGPEKTAL
jgi:hypothetical protein